MLSHNHVFLLQALLDRPGGAVPSYNAWVEAALPYARMLWRSPSEWSLRRGIRTFNLAWAARRREGSRVAVRLTPRGRAILDREIAAHVRAYGPYRGMATFRTTGAAGAG